MCKRCEHRCFDCDAIYDCDQPNWACSTINGDEDGNMCDRCLEEFAKEMMAFEEANGEPDVQS